MNTSRLVLASIGCAIFAAGAIRCTPFSEGTDSGVEGGAADGGIPSDGTTSNDAPTPKPDASARTGVACGAETTHCDAGENCCSDAAGRVVCAADCTAADASFIVAECARKSDCPSGFDCCASSNGGCAGSYYSGARCVPAGTCDLCRDDGGVGFFACDRLGTADCPPGTTCGREFQFTFYRVCTF